MLNLELRSIFDQRRYSNFIDVNYGRDAVTDTMTESCNYILRLHTKFSVIFDTYIVFSLVFDSLKHI